MSGAAPEPENTPAPPPSGSPRRPAPRGAAVALARLAVRVLVAAGGLAAAWVAYLLLRMGLRWLGAPLFFTIERG